MRLRLILIILIGIVASGLTLYFTSPKQAVVGEGDGSNPDLNNNQGKNPTKIRKSAESNQANRKALLKTKNYYATGRKEARLIASESTGRANPFGALARIESVHSTKSDQNSTSEGVPDLPPPPDVEGSQNGLLPPPPAMGDSGSIFGSNLPPEPGITTGELPLPPEPKDLISKLRLNAVIGDRAVLAFADKGFARTRGLKRYVTLGRGDSYQNVRLVDLDSEMAIVEENGKTRELKLPEMR